MSELLESIEIKKVVLNQYMSMLYEVVVYTNDRDYAYVHNRPERIEDEKELYDSEFFDFINYERISTKKLDFVEVINAVKRLEQFFDVRNKVVERLNGSADDMRETVKSSLETIFKTKIKVKIKG